MFSRLDIASDFKDYFLVIRERYCDIVRFFEVVWVNSLPLGQGPAHGKSLVVLPRLPNKQILHVMCRSQCRD